MNGIGFVLRHAETALNRAGMARGSADVPLDAQGVHQAKRLGAELMDKHGTSLRADTMRRTVQTARIIAAATGLRPVFTAGLGTLDIGRLSGRPDEEVLPAIAQHMRTSPSMPLVGGEAPLVWLYRIWPEIRLFLAQVLAGERPIIVTHGRVTAVIRAFIEGGGESLPIDILTADPSQQTGQIWTVVWQGGRFTIAGPVDGMKRDGEPPPPPR